MSEQGDALSDLGEAGVLDGLRWAWASARRQSLDAYDPATGHDQGWLGYNAYIVLRDRLDRVFSCERYAVQSEADVQVGEDLVAAGISGGEFTSMPRLTPTLVVRDGINGSPGWRYRHWRLLLQSYGTDHIDHLPWPQKSPTKQSVASQPVPGQAPLPGMERYTVLDDVTETGIRIVTLVGAYSIDGVTGESAFYLGRSRINPFATSAWHWKKRLDEGSGHGGRGQHEPQPSRPQSPIVPLVEDAPVRLRKVPSEGTADDSSGR